MAACCTSPLHIDLASHRFVHPPPVRTNGRWTHVKNNVAPSEATAERLRATTRQRTTHAPYGIITLMPYFLLRRLASFIATLVAASALVFAVLELLPGNAAQVILGESATPQSLAALESKLGLDQPAWVRYGRWVGGLLLGQSQHGIFGSLAFRFLPSAGYGAASVGVRGVAPRASVPPKPRLLG